MRVELLSIYPLKSGRAVALDAARVTREGLAGDRQYMVVDDEGVFVTQREHPKMARVSLETEGEGGVVSFDGASAALVFGDTSVPATVWGDAVVGQDCGDAAAALLSRALDHPVRLLKKDPSFDRPVDPRHASAGDVVSFADGFPLLVASRSSFDDVARRVAAPIDVGCFRANVVIDGAPAFDEDTWTRVRIGEVTFAVVKPCSRCLMVDLDQRTGEKAADVLKTLAAFRRVGHRVMFGQNVIPRSFGTVRVGDPVTVLARRDEA